MNEGRNYHIQQKVEQAFGTTCRHLRILASNLLLIFCLSKTHARVQYPKDLRLPLPVIAIKRSIKVIVAEFLASFS